MISQQKTVGKTTRVNGKGLWRSWKRNFKNKIQALLDLIDNSLDAAVQAEDEDDRVVGRVHVYPDTYEVKDGTSRISASTTGLCIINNCVKRIRPLEKVLEVYDSSKVDSGAGDIGENGVGLKQGCATLSDLSFVLVKNGSNRDIELGIIAESLQREEGCFLPSFKFSNDKRDGSSTLKKQMLSTFSKTSNADVSRCIARYGKVSSGSVDDLVVGVERLCQHFDHICKFHNNSHVFLVIMNSVHHGLTEEYTQNSMWGAQQKLTVNKLMRDLLKEIPKTYLHIPQSFDFTIGQEKAEFKYWPERMVCLSSFTVDVNPKIPWQQKMASECSESYQLRVFIGFDGMRITDTECTKEASLYIYSRQSGRLISHHADARTRLGLSAGGTAFCQGLTVIIDDFGGQLPLNPTKQEVAFGEELHGAVHRENLMAAVGGVVHFFYNFHLRKYNDRKTDLTRKIAAFGDELMEEDRDLKTLDSSDLTTYEISFKTVGKSIRADRNSAKEIVGADTLYVLQEEKKRSKKKARKPADSPAIPRRKRNREAEFESDEEEDESNDTDVSNHSVPYAAQLPRRRKPVSYLEVESEEEEEVELTDDSNHSAQPGGTGRKAKKSVADGEDMDEENNEQHAEDKNKKEVEFYKKLCSQLTDKLNSKKADNKTLRFELAQKTSELEEMTADLEKERSLRQSLAQQLKAAQSQQRAFRR